MSVAPAQAAYTVLECRPGVFNFRSRTRGSNVYLLVGSRRTVLVDTGLASSLPSLLEELGKIGVTLDRVDLVFLTHEHYDHIAAVSPFARRSLVAAHRLAANRIRIDDDFATVKSMFEAPMERFDVDVWLEDRSVIDTGSHLFEVLHTPGHTSGCVCLYDPATELLISGDTVMRNGVLGGIFGSGNIGDYIQSLERLAQLRISTILPGHGPHSEEGTSDVKTALARARALLSETREMFDALSNRERFDQVLESARNLNK